MSLAGSWGMVAVGSARAAGLTEGDAAAGVRTALERASAAAVSQLGRTDGFLGNPAVRIGLPGVLEDAAKLLRATGQQARVDALLTAMNRAAESAVPQARQLLINAVRSMSVEDAVQIVRGGDDSATRFFTEKTRTPLTERFLPIVHRETAKVSLAEHYNAVAGGAAGLGLLGRGEANLDQYVTGKALDGLYRTIAEEERKIRRDPVGTGSALLRRVFGSTR
jgi:hypothetical protein